MMSGLRIPSAGPLALRVRLIFWLLPWLLGIVSLLGQQVALGQVRVGVPSEEQELAENVFLPAPRTTLQRLAQARDLLQEGRFGEAVRNLGSILDAQEDFFFQPERDEPIHRSLKTEAQRLIGVMPSSGREVYELQYGPHARTMLVEALDQGDMVRLAEVSRRFFHTVAGYEATFLLGIHHLDHGRPLAGALTLERLCSTPGVAERFEPALSLGTATGWLQAGAPDRASTVLADLKRSRGERPIRLGGRDVDLFTSQQGAADWLVRFAGSLSGDPTDATSQWLLVRGNPSRNAPAGGGAPLMNIRWEVPVADDPIIEQSLAQQQQRLLEQGIPPVPELHPLVVGDIVLMRTTRNLLAVDVHTGKRLWEVPVDDPVESLLQSASEDPALRAQFQHVPLVVGERVLQDRTFGTLSSDGKQVYTIEDLMPSTGLTNARQLVRGAVRIMPGQPQPYNRLAAHEIRTGKLKWHLGGPSDEFALRMAETFFLGPPLPLQGQLFVLAEVKDEIRLLVLDAATGDLLWTQPLAIVEQGVLFSPIRRLSGLSPAYADGILVCPTSAGALVAVDMATRSLLWGYRYSQSVASRQRAPFFAMQLGRHPGNLQLSRWTDANPIIADGHVLFTPTESDTLYCLDLVDGRQRWTISREDDLYVACVHRGSVVLVGRQGVRAVGLADGKPAWEGRVLEFSDGGMPCGHGFYGGSQYLVPLSTAEIAVIDLDRGRTVHVARSRQGQVPGNLVSYQGMVLSQSAAGLGAFDQLDVLRHRVTDRLAKNPDDAEALALSGELLLDEGKRDEAILRLSRSYQLASERRAASLLREALLDGLRNDFGAFQDRVGEIEPLLDGARERAEFLRVMANGLQRTGQWNATFQHLLKLAELDDDSHRVEPVDRTLSARGDRWVRARLTALRAEATGEEAAEIECLVAARMQDAIEADSVDALTRFLDCFGGDEVAVPAWEALVKALTHAGKLLEVEMVLWSKPGLANPLSDGAGVARVADMLARANCDDDARAAYRFLVARHADTVCLDGKTGRELVTALPEGHAARPSASQDALWPEGRIDTQEVAANRPPTQGRYPLDFRGDPGPFFRNTVIRMDQNRRAISATDGLGKVRWTLPFIEPGSPQSIRFTPSSTYVRACGHLLILSLGSQIIAIDTLGHPGRGQARVLWSHDTNQGGFDQALIRLGGPGGVQWPQGMPFIPQNSRQLDSLGPVTPTYVCFQHYRNVITVDPLSGETLWVRHGVAPGATLFGDNEYVLAASPEQSDILVFSALDGSLVGQRSLPAPERFIDEPDGSLPAAQRRFGQTVMATLGRRIVVSYVDPADGRHVLGLFDPLEQRYIWGPIRSDIGKMTHLDELICLLAPDGTLRLVRTEDGQVIFDEKLSGETAATEVHLLRAGEQYMVVTNRPQAKDRGLRINPLPGTLYRPIGNGRVYAFDKNGKAMWPKPTAVNGQLLLLHQPEELPIFVFGSQPYDPQKVGTKRFSTQLVCLDKRNGRVVYRGGFAEPTATFEIVGDPEKGVIEIQFQRNVVKLQLTDQPLPPEEPETDDNSDQAESAPVHPGKAVLQAIGGAVRRMNVFRGAGDALQHIELLPEPEPDSEP